jgi:hypothetical protein
MELQINRDMLWLGILSFYLPLVLLIFRDGIATYNIADAEKRTAIWRTSSNYLRSG